MRIRLKPGKQRGIINGLKKGMTWREISEKLGLSEGYIRNELRNEERTLSEEVYKKICEIAKYNYDSFIDKRLKDNWGKSKGGLKSSGNIKIFSKLGENEKLAELFGIILGDGHLEIYKKGNKRCYALKIAGHMTEDYEYLAEYVSKLFEELFGEGGKIRKIPKMSEIFLTVYGKNLIKLLKGKGLMPGNKKLNNQGIPKWIKNNDLFLLSCLRGLIDTDGSLHFISKKNKNLRVSFTSHIPRLIKDVHNSFIRLGFRTSKIMGGRQIFISSKEDVSRYIKDVGFKNQKHLKRLETLSNKMPL